MRSNTTTPAKQSRVLRAPTTGRKDVSLAESVYQAFKNDVIRGNLSAGEALTENDLAARYKSSRTPVREAAARLQQENLLHIVASRGYFITEISIQGVNDIYDFRAAVESASAEFAAQCNWDPEIFKRLTILSTKDFVIDDRESYVRFIEADTEFHVGIARLTRNPLLIRAVTDMRSHMERIMFTSAEFGYYGEMPMHEHSGILKAIEKRDAKSARERMWEHIYISKDRVLRVASKGSRV